MVLGWAKPVEQAYATQRNGLCNDVHRRQSRDKREGTADKSNARLRIGAGGSGYKSQYRDRRLRRRIEAEVFTNSFPKKSNPLIGGHLDAGEVIKASVNKS